MRAKMESGANPERSRRCNCGVHTKLVTDFFREDGIDDDTGVRRHAQIGLSDSREDTIYSVQIRAMDFPMLFFYAF